MSDQRNNFKREVMEALDMVPANKLSGKAYQWVATNLPDEGKENGVYSSVAKPTLDFNNLDHSRNKVSEVFGYTEEQLEKLQKEFHKILRSYKEDFYDKTDDPKKSHFIAFFLQAASDELKFLMFMNELAEVSEKIEESPSKRKQDDLLSSLKTLQDLLEKLKKEKGDDTE